MLLPGGRDISQPRLAHQLSLCSASLYEESLLQHRDHVSKRNKFVIPVHRLGCAHILFCEELNLNLWNTQETDHKVLWIQTCANAKLPGKFALIVGQKRKTFLDLT